MSTKRLVPGRDTGSLINYLSVNLAYHKPVLNENVTECMWSDRHAWRVTSVDPDGKGAVLTKYEPKYVGKSYGDESYEYVDAEGKPLLSKETIHIRWKWNAWRTNGRHKINLAWGMCEKYRDPSF